MDCYICGKELIWGCDFDYDDYGKDGEGIVSTFSCPDDACSVECVEVYQNHESKNNKEE